MHSADGHAYISTGVKKHFMFLGELNGTICENGLNFRLLCIYFFKNISQLPGHLIKHSILCFLSGFLAFIQRLWLLFQGSFLPLTFFPAATLACEQALHLEDIVKSTRARGTREETRLWGAGKRKGELATISHKISFPPQKPRDIVKRENCHHRHATN